MSVLALFLPHVAHAGSYTISSYTCTDPRYFLYQVGPNQYVSFGYTGGTSGMSPLTYTLNGKITAIYTWTPNGPGDNPPASIIVAEDSVVGYQSLTGTLDPGLGSSTVTGGAGMTSTNTIFSGGTLALNAQSSIFTQSQQMKYWVLSNPGNTLTFTCTPSATASMPTGYGSIQAAARYFVTFNPPLAIALKGDTQDSSGNSNIVVGQKCTSSIVGIPAGSSATYQWSVTGPGPIYQSWNPGTLPTAGFSNATTLTETWWWDDMGPNPTTETVKCVVTVAGLPTTLTRPVTVQVPTINNVNLSVGNYQINTLCYGVGGALFLYAGVATGGSSGMNISATCKTPPSPLFGNGKGTLELVQIVTLNSSYTGYSGFPGVPGPTHLIPLNGQSGLDNFDPYLANPYTEGNTNPFSTNDSPGISLDGSIGSATLQSSFADTLLYQPPDSGNGVQWVPRGTYSWGGTGTASQSTGSWPNTGTQSYGTLSLTTPFTATNVYPTWTQVITNAEVALPWPVQH
jgi:hypothetical protein